MKKLLGVLVVLLIITSGLYADYDYGYSTVGAGYTFAYNVFDGGVSDIQTKQHVVGAQNLNVGYFENLPIGYLTYANIGYNLGDKTSLTNTRLTDTGFFGSLLVGLSYRLNIGSFGIDIGGGLTATINLYENLLGETHSTTFIGAGAYLGGVYSFNEKMMLIVGCSAGANFANFGGESIVINNYKYTIFANPSVSFGFTY